MSHAGYIPRDEWLKVHLSGVPLVVVGSNWLAIAIASGISGATLLAL